MITGHTKCIWKTKLKPKGKWSFNLVTLNNYPSTKTEIMRSLQWKWHYNLWFMKYIVLFVLFVRIIWKYSKNVKIFPTILYSNSAKLIYHRFSWMSRNKKHLISIIYSIKYTLYQNIATSKYITPGVDPEATKMKFLIFCSGTVIMTLDTKHNFIPLSLCIPIFV